MELQTAIGASAALGASDRDRSPRERSPIDRSRAAIGQAITLSMPEMGLDGPARIVRVEPCPANLAGSATGIVTGTFVREAPETLSLYIDALSQPIGVTPSHPFWSLDRQGWIAAGDLAIGERLATLDGPAIVVKAEQDSSAHTVYNIEVYGDHTYFVSEAKVLAHNNCLKKAQEAYRRNADFRRWLHRVYKPGVMTPGPGRDNPDLSDEDRLDAYEQWIELGKPREPYRLLCIRSLGFVITPELSLRNLHPSSTSLFLKLVLQCTSG